MNVSLIFYASILQKKKNIKKSPVSFTKLPGFDLALAG